jgi:Helitron helicase-like domain at N-terminus
MHKVRCRKIVVAHKGKLKPDFVDILSPLYEPLQYPLLFPFGDPGWSREGSRLFQPPRSQCQWYRFRLLNEPRFLQFGRLTCEYIVDMYSRIEDERLQYIREGKLRQAGEVFAGEEDTQEKDDYEMELQRAFASVLPSSFLGSRAWTSERVADALALLRSLDKPSLLTR